MKQTITKHPDYLSRFKDNDIALIELKKSVKFDYNLFPACINTKESDSKELLISGFGKINTRNGKTNA